jgi:hypothetical protein
VTKEAAVIELTLEQHEALVANNGGSVRARDPVTRDEFVIVRAEIYDRIKLLIADNQSWAESAYSAATEVFARDGWDDPRMDVYDALGPQENP